MLELWPFTNFHDLNLDWMIKTIEVFTKKVDNWITWLKDQIDQMHADFAEYVNVTEGALSTGAIANGAITKPKIESTFLTEIENPYVTPQMYGATGDGVTDDTNAFAQALSEHKHVLVPEGDYLITDTVTMANDSILEGTGAGSAKIIIDAGAGNAGFTQGTGCAFKNLTVTGDSTSNFANGSGYKLTVENCVFTNIDTAFDCVSGLMLALISNVEFNGIQKAFSIKNPSTACHFDHVLCAYTPVFISQDATGTKILESFLFNNCTFEGVNTQAPEITVFKSDYTVGGTDKRLAIRNVDFVGCYFESNGRVFTNVLGCTAKFDSCWFYYQSNHTGAYLQVNNTDSTYPGTVIVTNCNLEKNQNLGNDVLIGSASNMTYYIQNVMYGRNKITQADLGYQNVYYLENNTQIVFTQTENLTAGSSVTFSYDYLRTGTPQNFLVAMTGGSNTNVWNCLYMLIIGETNTQLIPIVNNACTLALAANSSLTLTNTNSTYQLNVDHPFSIVFTKLG